MRIAAIGATLLFAFASCSTTDTNGPSPYQQPNELMGGEISRRVEQIPYQHRDELLENLLWLAQTGEQTIPALLTGLRHESPKVRSSCAWVLGRIRDRRTIDGLQDAMRDSEPGVRLEAARSLVLMGDLAPAPTLIEGLDSDRKEVRYLCHEALKEATGHDYGYDHLNQNQRELQVAVLRWREWWSDYSGDRFFASNYQKQHDIGAELAAPMGEIKPNAQPAQPEQATPVQQSAAPAGDQAAPTPVQTPTNAPVETPPQTPTNPAPTNPAPTDPAPTNAAPAATTPAPVEAPQPDAVTPAPAKPAAGEPKPTEVEPSTTPTGESSANPAGKKPVVELPIVEIPAKQPSKPQLPKIGAGGSKPNGDGN